MASSPAASGTPASGGVTRSEHGHFIRGTAVMSLLTLASRVLGLVRDVASASIFAAGAEWDAFVFAFRVPNLFRKLFAEGALAAAFIPVFAEYEELKSREETWRLTSQVGTALGAVLIALLLLCEAAVLIALAAHPGPRWQLALALTALLLLYMPLVCMTSLAGAVLNAMKHFFTPALAPVILNMCWIAAMVVLAPMVTGNASGRVFVVAGGILVAGVAQLGAQVLALRRRGFRFRIGLDLKDPGLRRVAAGFLPMLLGLAAFQVNVLLDGFIALLLSGPPGRGAFSVMGMSFSRPMLTGANSVLYYANRLMQFPLGVFGVSLATATFPILSALAARRDWKSFSRTLTDGLRLGTFVALPAAVGLSLLAQPTVELLFEHGRFTPAMTGRTVAALMAYCAGIWAYCSQQVLLRGFYSLRDTRTPLRVGLAAVGLNLVLNLVLVWPLAECGLAAATAISASAQFAVLYWILARRGYLTGQKPLLWTLLRSGACASLMAGAVWAVLRLMPYGASAGGFWMRAARVVLPVCAGAAVYLGSAVLLRSPELKQVLGALARRRSGG